MWKVGGLKIVTAASRRIIWPGWNRNWWKSAFFYKTLRTRKFSMWKFFEGSTLEPIWKSDLHCTPDSTTSETASYTNRSDQGDQTLQADQAIWGAQTHQTDQGDQTNIPTRYNARGVVKHAKKPISIFKEWARQSVSDNHQCKRCWRIWKTRFY